MEVIEGVVRRYDWGSSTAIPTLLGTVADGGPQAELWLGAHPSAPARAGAWQLDELIGKDPERMLGPKLLNRFGARLPFLLKVLAAAEPLSLQAHPSTARAEVGFAEDDLAGIPLDSPQRRYKDSNHKPELLCALSRFDALCGFRPIQATLALLDNLGLVQLPAFSPLAAGDLRSTVGGLLSMADGERAEVAGEIAEAAAKADGAEAVWTRRIAATHPGDPGVGVALLLNLVQLEPGDAIYLAAGNLHAYLEGVGIEIMASSDNVLRGGLTTKHVDVDELMAILDFQPGPPPLVTARQDGNVLRYDTPVDEFALATVELATTAATFPSDRPRIVLCLEGEAALATAGDELRLRKGMAAWVPACDGPVSLTGHGLAVVATTP